MKKEACTMQREIREVSMDNCDGGCLWIFFLMLDTIFPFRINSCVMEKIKFTFSFSHERHEVQSDDNDDDD
jgi:hypothetical protein